jgi:hypothetical protein
MMVLKLLVADNDILDGIEDDDCESNEMKNCYVTQSPQLL